MFKSKEQVAKNIALGISFGYNKCCIEYFHLRQVKGEALELNRKLKGTGVICCKECNKKYTDKELLEQINTKRLYSENFSQDFTVGREIPIELNPLIYTEENLSFIQELIENIEKIIKLD